MWPFGAKAREPQAAVDPVTGAIVEDAASRTLASSPSAPPIAKTRRRSP